MKKHYLSLAVAALLGSSLLFTSCIGSFNLTHKLLNWNQQIGSKFVNELVFFAFWIIPVYEVSALADLLVINSIEFWSGSNPVAKKGTTVVEGQDGKYLVECDGRGYTITSQTDGTTCRLDYTPSDQSWSLTAQGKTYKLMTFIDDSHVKMLTPTGEFRTVELSQAGVLAYRQEASSALMAQK